MITTAALALLATVGMPHAARAAEPPATHIAACGLEFDLPAGYKITRPKRSADTGNGARCGFDIVKARPEPPQRGECKDKEEGGSPPYDVCDWVIDTGTPSPSVEVVRTRPGGLPLLDAFWLERDGRWMVPNAQAGDQPAQSIDFFGKPAWKGETIVRLGWRRTRTKNYTGIYAGSGGTDVMLVRFAPDLLVQLQAPPQDSDGTCQTFCASLRLGERRQDLP